MSHSGVQDPVRLRSFRPRGGRAGGVPWRWIFYLFFLVCLAFSPCVCLFAFFVLSDLHFCLSYISVAGCLLFSYFLGCLLVYFCSAYFAVGYLLVSLALSTFPHIFSLVCLRSCLFTCQTVKSCLPHLSLSVCHLNSLSTIQLSLPVRWSFLVNSEWRRSQDIVLSRCLYSFVDTAVNVAPCLRL